MNTSAAVYGMDFGAPPRRRSAIHLLTLAIVWLTFACSAIVFTEPSPYDVLMLGLIVLLPLVRLVVIKPLLVIYLLLWLVVAAGGFIAVTQAQLTDVAAKHTGISFFLAISSVMIAGFVAANPERHTRLIMSGYTAAAIIATAAAVIGYFHLLPGAYELFTKFSRARGTFEDPNVYGPFIVPILLYAAHGMIAGGGRQTLTSGALFAFMLLGMLLTFSRGAWINAGAAFAIFAFLEFTTSPTNRRRLKLILFGLLGFIVVLGVVTAAMQVATIADLYQQRASLSLGYDVGPEGRFGGQLKALDIILRSPFGLGGLEFGAFYHHEDAHNVYLSMFLNAGWLGGLAYLIVVVATLAGAACTVLRTSPMRGHLIVLFAAFAGLAGEGFVIDTDHWRHFYVLLGLIWGLLAAYPAVWPDTAWVGSPERNGRSGEI